MNHGVHALPVSSLARGTFLCRKHPWQFPLSVLVSLVSLLQCFLEGKCWKVAWSPDQEDGNGALGPLLQCVVSPKGGGATPSRCKEVTAKPCLNFQTLAFLSKGEEPWAPGWVQLLDIFY